MVALYDGMVEIKMIKNEIIIIRLVLKSTFESRRTSVWSSKLKLRTAK